MLNWNFVPRKFLKPWNKVYDELCAPAPFVMDDALFVIGSTYTQDFPIWKSTNPHVDDWTEAVAGFKAGAWDPAFFLDRFTTILTLLQSLVDQAPQPVRPRLEYIWQSIWRMRANFERTAAG